MFLISTCIVVNLVQCGSMCLMYSSFMPFFPLEFYGYFIPCFSIAAVLYCYRTEPVKCPWTWSLRAVSNRTVQSCLAIEEYWEMMQTKQPRAYAWVENLRVSLLVYLVVKVLLWALCLIRWIWLRTITSVERSTLQQFGIAHLRVEHSSVILRQLSVYQGKICHEHVPWNYSENQLPHNRPTLLS